MRLHHLTLTAFGPFAGTERVDFDELAEAGVFLVTGATGAGKSSLLDAVCFALYGVVPGPRGVKALRSDHAAPDLAPEVTLDFSVRGRRFVVRRSPEWSRSRRGGTGVTTVRAAASLMETTGGVERLVSGRAQEVGHTVTDLLQLSSAQFQQVVLLPQGGFATFLRASSQERHDVLQQLFHARRFADIETWVHDHSRSVRAAASAAADDVRRYAHTLADRAGQPPPHPVDDDTLATTGPGRLVAWADQVAGAADADAAEAGERRRSAEQEHADARADHEEARRQAGLRARRDAALAASAELERSAPEAERAATALADAERAARVTPLLGLLEEAERTAAACVQARDRALRRLPPVVADDAPDAAALAMWHGARRDVLTRVVALLPREEELQRAEVGLEAARARLRDAGAAAEDLRERCSALPQRLQGLRASLDALTAEAARVDLLATEAAAARRVHEAAAALPVAQARALDARAAAVAARAGAVSAHDALLGLVERRLAGMAAELAGALRDGDPCPVCGSADHPVVAAPGADPVEPGDIDAARRLIQTRQAEASEAERAAADAAACAQRVAEAAAGRDEATARSELAGLALAAERASAAVRERDAVALDVDRLRDSEQQLQSALRDASTEEAAALTRHAAAEREVHRLRAEVADAAAAARSDADRGSCPGTVRLADLVETVRAEVRLLEQVTHTARAAEQTTAERDRVRARAEAAAAVEGFLSIGAARSAVLAQAERERLESLLRDRDRERDHAEAVLAEPEVAGLEESAVAEPSVTARALADAEAQCAEATRLAHLCEETRRATARTAAKLREAVEAWAPLRDEASTAETMARLVRGTGADNQLQMRLSAYVLATRLDQVVDAANERLGGMREHRYLLERTARVQRRGTPAGLGLQVLDLWTGDARDPATLSGGETFVVSLALALGLADVVTNEAGGVELQTLFVDEGFGMLDADTLDDVMDRLDGLRTSGRTVGVVSHVSELRGRIPVQLHVHKSSRGSRVEVRTLVA
jgi:exonuclease SbcC